MNPELSPRETIDLTRRDFFATTGLGTIALADLLSRDGLIAPSAQAGRRNDPLAPKQPHFTPKAKNCILIYFEGAPSHVDLFDPKPKLNEMDGKPLPEDMLEKVRFAFIKKEGVRLMGSPRKFTKYGQCGMELSDLLPHLGGVADEIAWLRGMHTTQFNHHPGQLMMNSGSALFGRPTFGSWLNYGLGSESEDLPGYVVLTAGRGSSGGSSQWSSGFLPTSYAGVLFRNSGDPVLNLSNPPGFTKEMQHLGLDAIGDLNKLRYKHVADPEISSRIAAYELAGRMQASAPELMDLSGESETTKEAYGLNRTTPNLRNRGGGAGTYETFARNCLLARRLIERGTRFVNVLHASWDHHSNINKELPFCAGMCDQPIAALILDLKMRGMLEETMVVWASEFGRTPLGENRTTRSGVTGRDHHPYAFTVWAAGGGIKGGQIVGETDEMGWGVTKDPVTPHDLHATILNQFGFHHEDLTYRFQGLDFRLTGFEGADVIKQIV
ncbi:MAG: sulfatase [Verrucomicrobiales bacterium]|nr:sulfatase [Verrucomicrobiales bacterium]|tara:strand:- start:11974 stop:13461 length:1488 start_codon:yes stop_codon:yes gene_type:complete